MNLKPRDCSAFGWILISAKRKKPNRDIHTGSNKEVFQLRLAESVDRTEGH